jgi:carboxypeptidase Taq
LPADEYGMPLGAAASLSIHESQSRLWENMVGRGPEFWTSFYPRLQKHFPSQLASVPARAFYEGTNKVQPSLIRTESDELTYHYHVLIRYTLEKSLIEGSLEAKDIPEQWRVLYRQYLGIEPPDDVLGSMQDVHWSHGSFGYFPTYSLGSFYAAQFFAQARQEIDGLDAQIAAGTFDRLLQWLRQKVHVHGRRYRSEELCTMITGRPLDIRVFLDYAKQKYSGIYKIEIP